MSTDLIAKRIKEARLKSNLSQRELSKALRVSEKAVSSYEAGRTKPSVQTLEEIAKKTDKPLGFFTTGKTTEYSIVSLLRNIEKELKQVQELIKQSR